MLTSPKKQDYFSLGSAINQSKLSLFLPEKYAYISNEPNIQTPEIKYQAAISSMSPDKHYEQIVNGQIVNEKEAQLRKAISASDHAFKKLKTFTWAGWLIIALYSFLSVLSLWKQGIYTIGKDNRESPELYAEDAVNVFLGIPLLSISHYFTMKGSVRGFIFWMAGLSFVFYNYLVYAFETNFNALFLGYIVLISASSFSLFGVLWMVDMRLIKYHFQPTTPTTTLAIYLVVVALCKLVTWVATYLAILQLNEQPEQKSAFILDLSFIVPAYFLVAYMCWCKKSMGYVLAGVFIVDSVAMGIGTVSKCITVMVLKQETPMISTLHLRLCLFGGVMLAGFVMIPVYLKYLEPSIQRSQLFSGLPGSTSDSNLYEKRAGSFQLNQSSDDPYLEGGCQDGSNYISLRQARQLASESSASSPDHEKSFTFEGVLAPGPQSGQKRMHVSHSHDSFYASL